MVLQDRVIDDHMRPDARNLFFKDRYLTTRCILFDEIDSLAELFLVFIDVEEDAFAN
mgnify:CR=1 FL=1